MSILVQGGTIVTMNPNRDVLVGDVLIDGTEIKAVGKVHVGQGAQAPYLTIDAGGKIVLPGLVQTHIHLCQTLFRGFAEDMELLDWLQKRIWPLEAAHTPASLALSARLGIAELLRGGTTTILDMGTVHDHDVVFHEAVRAGIRYVGGKAIMDTPDTIAGLHETTDAALSECYSQYKRWHGAEDGRISFAFCPRFVLCNTEKLLRAVGDLARQQHVTIHTHASENRTETKVVLDRTGKSNIEYLHHLRMTGENLVIAHAVWLKEHEVMAMAETSTRVAHCPSSNLKLASGICDTVKLRKAGVTVGIGADGAACNNSLDGFQEMRLAALLPRLAHGPRAMPAIRALEMATIEGARSLGMDARIGSIEKGKKADLIVLDLPELHAHPEADLYATIVYSAHACSVETVMVDGMPMVRDRRLLTIDAQETTALAGMEFQKLLRRSGVT